MTFQKRLLYLRKRNCLTIRQVSEKLGVSQSTYFQWEVESFPTKPVYYKMLAMLYGFDVERLMFGG
ncbi:MAG: helix-turn-helix transcriptional regulator [Pseudomonadota bacterium]